jgi:hypothetical protein
MSKAVKFITVLVILGIISGLSFTTYYFYSQYQKAQSLVANPQEITKNEIADLVAKISVSMDLPAEQPTLATILEADKLKDQPFFINAQNGDKVLIYAEAKKAILYRPSTNKIVEVSPLSLVNNAEIPSNGATPTAKVTKAPTPTPTEEPTPAPSE